MNANLLGSLAEAGAVAHEVQEGQSPWAAWSLDLPVLIPIGLAAYFYARGLHRWTDRHRAHPWWRTALYYSGLVSLALALVSPIDALGSHHFFMHMIQHEIAIMIAVPLLLLGAPTTPMLRGMPRWLRLGLVAGLAGDPIVRGVWRLLTHPLIALVLYTVVLWLWHLAPGWYDAAVRHEGIHFLEHLTFVGAAFLFWWNVIDPAPLRAPMGYMLRIVYLVAAGTTQSALAALLTMADHPLYDVYVEGRRVLDMDPMTDQQLGGLIMWVPGQLVHLVAVGVLFAVWLVKAEQRQREVEADAAAHASSEQRQRPA